MLYNTSRVCKSHWPKWSGGEKGPKWAEISFQNSFLKEHVRSDRDRQHYLTGDSSCWSLCFLFLNKCVLNCVLCYIRVGDSKLDEM